MRPARFAMPAIETQPPAGYSVSSGGRAREQQPSPRPEFFTEQSTMMCPPSFESEGANVNSYGWPREQQRSPRAEHFTGETTTVTLSPRRSDLEEGNAYSTPHGAQNLIAAMPPGARDQAFSFGDDRCNEQSMATYPTRWE